MKGLAITDVLAGPAGIDSLEVFVNYWDLLVFFFCWGYFLKYKHILLYSNEQLVGAMQLLLALFIVSIFLLFIKISIIHKLGIYQSYAMFFDYCLVLLLVIITNFYMAIFMDAKIYMIVGIIFSIIASKLCNKLKICLE